MGSTMVGCNQPDVAMLELVGVVIYGVTDTNETDPVGEGD